MDFHGFPWISMDFHGFSWISMDFHGFSWIFMDFHGFSWIFIDFDGSRGIHQIPKILTNCPIPCKNHQKTIKFHGFGSFCLPLSRWGGFQTSENVDFWPDFMESTKIHGNPWKSMSKMRGNGVLHPEITSWSGFKPVSASQSPIETRRRAAQLVSSRFEPPNGGFACILAGKVREIHGNPWKSMKINQNRREATKPYEKQPKANKIPRNAKLEAQKIAKHKLKNAKSLNTKT